jgi:cytochrome c oxidase cbb3-type subunit I/II
MTTETFSYDNKVVQYFAIATLVWGIVGFLVGLIIAIQLFLPQLNLGIQFTTYSRLRPIHTNAVIFAFVGNAIFMSVYHSLQRLCKARMFVRVPV